MCRHVRVTSLDDVIDSLARGSVSWQAFVGFGLLAPRVHPHGGTGRREGRRFVAHRVRHFTLSRRDIPTNVNPLQGRRVNCVKSGSTLCHPHLTYIFNFWHSGTLTRKVHQADLVLVCDEGSFLYTQTHAAITICTTLINIQADRNTHR